MHRTASKSLSASHSLHQQVTGRTLTRTRIRGTLGAVFRALGRHSGARADEGLAVFHAKSGFRKGENDESYTLVGDGGALPG